MKTTIQFVEKTYTLGNQYKIACIALGVLSTSQYWHQFPQQRKPH